MTGVTTTLKHAFSYLPFARASLTNEQKQKRYVAQQLANCDRYRRHLKSELEKEKIDLRHYHLTGGRISEKVANNMVSTLEKPSQLLFQKYNVVCVARDILFFQGEKGIEEYKQYLGENYDVLAKRRDDQCISFLKGLGVAVGTAFALVGGYIAYHSFFGNRATEGKKLFRDSGAERIETQEQNVSLSLVETTTKIELAHK